MSVELSEQFFAQAAGWQVMKMARAYVENDQVLSSDWSPPLLKGVVQAGGNSYRAGLVIKSATNIENICTCRESQEWGTLCAHSVGVGLHFLKLRNLPLQPSVSRSPPLGERPGLRGPLPATPKQPGATLKRSENGQLLELFIILPPNIEQALGKDKVMLCFEGSWQRGRSPLNALPKSESYRLSEQDGRVLDAVEQLAGGVTPPMLMLATEQFTTLLPLLVEHPRMTLGRSITVSVKSEPSRVPLRAQLESGGEITIELKQQTAPPTRVGPAGAWCFRQNTFHPLGLSKTVAGIFSGPIRISRQQVPMFLNQDWPRLATGSVEANFKIEDFELAPQKPEFLLELKGGLAQLAALLQCKYGARIMTIGVTSNEESLWLPDPESPTRYGTRDFAAEQEALGRLQRSGFTGPDAHGRYQLLGQNGVLNFFAREYPRLEREWKVTMEERLQKSTRENIERIEPAFQITSSGVQWFDLQVSFASAGGERFSAADIQRLLLSGQSHTRLRSGKVAVIDTGAVDELQEVLLDCAPEQHGGGYRINNAQAGFLDATLQQHSKWQVQAPSAWKTRVASLSGEANIECPPLGALENILRPYQKQGVAWLHFLRRNGFGGILADEMGLGKTLQTLALLQTTTDDRRKSIRPCLIVCPTSLVFNWLDEAKRFAPELKVLALTGPDRLAALSLSSTGGEGRGEEAHIANFDLVVTSYALIRRDADHYRSLEFDTVILDEAQHIKNRQTQNAQAVKSIRSQHRLVLTGTPLENSVLDLWSIFDFLMPGYLGGAQDFRERYEIPITREKDNASQVRLARRLKPFMLRRLKRDVVKDLPEKLEQVSFCELTADQQQVYTQVLEASRKEVMDTVGAQGLARSRMVILSALLRLRQVCCDLRLLKLEQTNAETASSKLDLFSELLEEVIDGGHRVLVFSQFVSMLTLIRERLDAEQIAYTYLDGSTPNRGEVVARFQNDSSIPVFLISLKAGGVGLNLTGADTVIHFDPWWNPAVEAQATDRAHRIGQTRVVTSYKLIARNTVEEKILLLQNRKRELIDATLGGEETFAERLNWDEVQELFRS